MESADRLPTNLAFFMSVLIDKSVGPQESGQRTAMQCVISAGGGGGGGAESHVLLSELCTLDFRFEFNGKLASVEHTLQKLY